MKRKKLIHLRIENDLTQQQFADILGVTRPYIGSIESGKANGSYKFWYKFKTIFKITDEDIESYKKVY